MTQVDPKVTEALYAEPRMMAGLCGRGGGKKAHAVAGGPWAFQRALCGARPGFRTNGWGPWIAPAITCPRCLAKTVKLLRGRA